LLLGCQFSVGGNKAVTLAYSKQTYANREEAQTDKTWTLST
jgi:hypothetical protein